MTTEAERIAKLLDAEQVRTVHLDVMHHDAAKLLREQAAEIERITDLYTRLKKMVDDGSINQRMFSAGVQSERELAAKDALLRQALDVIQSECGYGGTNDYDPRAICDAIKTHLEGQQ